MTSRRLAGGFAALALGATALLTTASPAHAACLPPSYCGPSYVVPVSTTATGEFMTPHMQPDKSISQDGRFVAFSTPAALVPEDTNGKTDVYRKDVETKAVVRVSLRAGGGQLNDWSADPSISADGRYVAFNSYATNVQSNLVLPGVPHHVNLFRKDLWTGAVATINLRSDGTSGGTYA